MAELAELPRLLEIAGQILITQTTNEVRLTEAKRSPSQRVAFAAVGDDCPLCQSMDGKVFDAQSPEAASFTPPLHINCDDLLMEVLDDERGAVDTFTPEDAERLKPLVEQHGHFVSHPDRYAALRIPAAPIGRDFTFRRGSAGEKGSIEWHRERYEITDLDAGVRQTGVTATGPGFTPVGG